LNAISDIAPTKPEIPRSSFVMIPPTLSWRW